MGGPVFEKVYKIVMRIPKGRVLTYGLISNLLGGGLSAQGVGWALKALPDGDGGSSSKTKGKAKGKDGAGAVKYTSQTVPWHRVINATGGTSTHKIGAIPPDMQRHLLESEGLVFNEEGKVDLKKYLWLEGEMYTTG